MEGGSAKYEDERKLYDQLKLDIGKSEQVIAGFKKRIQDFEQQIQEKRNAKDGIEERMSKRESMIDHYQRKVDAIQVALDKLNVSSANNVHDDVI